MMVTIRQPRKTIGYLALSFFLWGCNSAIHETWYALKSSPSDINEKTSSLPVLSSNKANVAVIYQQTAQAGVQEAAREIVRALSKITGKKFPAPRAWRKNASIEAIPQDIVVVIGQGLLSQDAIPKSALQDLGKQGYAWLGQETKTGKTIFQIAANTDVGLQYGTYSLLHELGVRYFHPADTYYPKNKNLSLTRGLKHKSKPGFLLRGFHHHTQHPIPMSVYLLEPHEKNLPYVHKYLQWLVHNRQNLLQFHLLKTVNLKQWLPYIKKIKDLADLYGIKLGLALSFADQQQNNFRLIDSLDLSLKEQAVAINNGLDQLLAGGFDTFLFQFGTSEFTKVKDKVALFWLNTAANHLKNKNASAYAWVHTSGEVKADDKKRYFYHLPEEASSDMGVFVHTTMFYDLVHAAPVYNNEDFTHQLKFIERVIKDRQVVYFPESSWWLGFDNNVPLATPITGFSRANDILNVLEKKNIFGHITFTSGMEWGYWKYDHYLTLATWDRKTTWHEYLDDFSSIFGKAKYAVKKALVGLTDLQVKYFYDEDPLLYFYLAGELQQDELGQQVGVSARRPKRSFKEILNLSEAQFAKWESAEFAKLHQMNREVKNIFADLLSVQDCCSDLLLKKLFTELKGSLKIFQLRIEHTILLYDAVRHVRFGRKDGGVGALSRGEDKKRAFHQASDLLAQAKSLSKKVMQEVKLMQNNVYRYPKEILWTKRDSLTSYKFGYLWETYTGFFWTRREKQLQNLLNGLSITPKIKQDLPSSITVFGLPASAIKIKDPKGPLVEKVLSSILPGLLITIPNKAMRIGLINEPWSIAPYHEAKKINLGEKTQIKDGKVHLNENRFLFGGKMPSFNLPIQDRAGNDLGKIGLRNVEISFELILKNDKPIGLRNGSLAAQIALEDIFTVTKNVSGIDKKGLLQIVATLVGFDPKNPPATLPLTLGMNVAERLK